MRTGLQTDLPLQLTEIQLICSRAIRVLRKSHAATPLSTLGCTPWRVSAFLTSYAASHSHPHSTTGSQAVCWPAVCHSTFPGLKAVTTLCLQLEIRDLNAKTWECKAETRRTNFEFTPLDLCQSGNSLYKSEPLQKSRGENIQAPQCSHLQSWLARSTASLLFSHNSFWTYNPISTKTSTGQKLSKNNYISESFMTTGNRVNWHARG